MKGIYSVVFVIGVLVIGGEAFPNQRPARFGYDVSDTVYAPYEERRSLYEDTEYDAPIGGQEREEEPNFNPFAYAPLASFVQSMQAMMKKVQMQMGEVLSRMPPQEIDWGKLGNTTSHTKVVNGHRITVNETSYSNKELSSAGAVLHIRVVDVKPEEGSSESHNEDTSSHVNNEGSNEIPEKTDQTDERKFIYRIPESETRVERRQSNEDDFQTDSLNAVDNSVEVFQPVNPYDLSGDTRVNNLIRDQVKKGGLVMIDPDAELIDVVEGKVRKTYYPYQSLYDQQRTQPIFP